MKVCIARNIRENENVCHSIKLYVGTYVNLALLGKKYTYTTLHVTCCTSNET